MSAKPNDFDILMLIALIVGVPAAILGSVASIIFFNGDFFAGVFVCLALSIGIFAIIIASISSKCEAEGQSYLKSFLETWDGRQFDLLPITVSDAFLLLSQNERGEQFVSFGINLTGNSTDFLRVPMASVNLMPDDSHVGPPVAKFEWRTPNCAPNEPPASPIKWAIEHGMLVKVNVTGHPQDCRFQVQ